MEITLTRKDEEKLFLGRLAGDLNLKKASTALEKSLGRFTVHLIDRKTAQSDEKLKKHLCERGKSGTKIVKSCPSQVKHLIEKSKKTKKMELTKWGFQNYAFSYPLKFKMETFGYMVGVGAGSKPPQAELDLFGCFIETVLNAIGKEIQLEELRKSVKPRTIALSTVHTIHRLISSSLYLDELLSRVARLSMQIIRAHRCSIKLVDSKRKTLLPKATVDLRTKKTKLKKIKIGRWAPGKAVKYGKSIAGAKYLATPLIDEDVIGVITLYDKVDNKPFDDYDVEIMRTLAEQAAVAIKNAQLYREQEKLTTGSIKALAQLIESRGAGICTPSSSFLKIVQLIGQEFGLREHELKTLQYATLLHDTGELMVPEKLIRKKGRLTEREFRLIKEHPLKGAKLIKSLKSLKSIAPIIVCHHENYNGTGYPKGLKGNEIPIGARILAVVDAFEAMITKRPYRVPLPMGRAIEEIKKHSGKQFDPKIVAAFLKVVGRKDVAKMIKKQMK